LMEPQRNDIRGFSKVIKEKSGGKKVLKKTHVRAEHCAYLREQIRTYWE